MVQKNLNNRFLRNVMSVQARKDNDWQTEGIRPLLLDISTKHREQIECLIEKL